MQVLVRLCFAMAMLHADVNEVLQLMEASKESLCDNDGKNMVRTW